MFTHTAFVLTAIPIEYQAVLAHLSDVHERYHPRGSIYQQGRFVAGKQSWEVAIAEAGAGNTGAASETERAVEYFQPDVILFVGIAGGLKDVKIGDVVASTKVYGYESGKAGKDFKVRPDLFNSTYAMEQRAMAVARRGEWLQRLPDIPSPLPRTYIGPIASGEK